MKWIEIKSETDLPEEGKYVIAKHSRGTWRDSDDQENVNTVIVKLKRGISEEYRSQIKGTELDYQDSEPQDLGFCKISGLRSDAYKFGDVGGNNEVPWRWDSFGPDEFFGQDITHWAAIEPLP